MGAVKRKITFTDPDGVEVTEDWWFQFDESDAVEMDYVHDLLKMDNPQKYLDDIAKNKDTKTLLGLWRELLLASAGKRDGKLIDKDKAVVRQFRYGGAYRALFSELISEDDAGASFFRDIMPERVQKQMHEEVTRRYSDEELYAMSDDEFYKAAGTDKVEEMDKRFLPIAFRRRTTA